MAVRTIVVGDKCSVDLVIFSTVYKLKYKIADKVYPYYCFVVSIYEAPP